MKKEKSILEYSSLKEAMRNTGYIDQSINPEWTSPKAKYSAMLIRWSITRYHNFMKAKKRQVISEGGVWVEWVRSRFEQLKRCVAIIEYMRQQNSIPYCKCAKCNTLLGRNFTYEEHIRKNLYGILGLCNDCEQEIVPFK